MLLQAHLSNRLPALRGDITKPIAAQLVINCGEQHRRSCREEQTL